MWEREKADVCGREGREAVMVRVGVRGEKGVKNHCSNVSRTHTTKLVGEGRGRGLDTTGPYSIMGQPAPPASGTISDEIYYTF